MIRLLKDREETDRIYRKKAKDFYTGMKDFFNKNLLEMIQRNNDYGDPWITKEFKRDLHGTFILKAGLIDRKYDNLYILFAVKRTIDFGLGIFRNKQVITLPLLDNAWELKEKFNIKLIMIERDFIHEFIHYLDTLRYKGDVKTTSRQKYKKGDLIGYYNTPAEFNAYYQEYIDTIIDILNKIPQSKKNELLKDYETFYNWITTAGGIDRDFVKALNKEYEKKLRKRLYDLYRTLLTEM